MKRLRNILTGALLDAGSIVTCCCMQADSIPVTKTDLWLSF